MLNLFFPEICRGCGEELISGEYGICVHCRHALPLACFHRNEDDGMKKMFYGRIPLENATALLYFQKKGLTQKFIHALKYKGAKNIGTVFGQWLGGELSEIENYRQIDAVVPVPLHKKKLRKRGYNQVENFGKEIAKALNKPYIDDVLVKVSPTKSQVFKERIARIFTTAEVFQVQNPHKIENLHILVVDDVITTGATLEACASKLLEHGNIKISFAVIGIAD